MENQGTFQIVSCSGASNTGLYADEVARQLNNDKDASMVCLAKMAINDKGLINKVKSKNNKIVVLDGCAVNCAKKILEKVGITEIIHLNTTDFDIVKGKTPYTDKKARKIVEHIRNIVQ